MKCKILTDITWQNYPWNDSPDPHPWAFPIDQVNKGQAHKCMTRFENFPVTIFFFQGSERQKWKSLPKGRFDHEVEPSLLENHEHNIT